MMKNTKRFALEVGGLLSVGLLLQGCSGPKPEVVSSRVLKPSVPGHPYRIEAKVHNRCSGEGQISIDARLREPASGRVYVEEKKAELKPNETILVVIEISAEPGDYQPEVDAQYPPD